jgi:hypothetical protein
MAVYQDKAIERIKGGLRRQISLIDKAIAGKWQEADTRKIVKVSDTGKTLRFLIKCFSIANAAATAR